MVQPQYLKTFFLNVHWFYRVPSLVTLKKSIFYVHVWEPQVKSWPIFNHEQLLMMEIPNLSIHWFKHKTFAFWVNKHETFYPNIRMRYLPHTSTWDGKISRIKKKDAFMICAIPQNLDLGNFESMVGEKWNTTRSYWWNMWQGNNTLEVSSYKTHTVL